MPVGFLSQADRERFNRFPETIPHDDLVAYFLLTEPDLAQVQRCREETTRLGFALQLCALRFLGFVPDDLSGSPMGVIEFVADQLQLSPGSLLSYGQRPATRTAHFQQLLHYLGFRKPTDADLQQLSQWLLARALEHDRPTLLLQMASEYLLREKWVRPGISRLEQWVSRARSQAQEETYRALLPLLPPSRCQWLDALLETDAESHRDRNQRPTPPGVRMHPSQAQRVVFPARHLHRSEKLANRHPRHAGGALSGRRRQRTDPCHRPGPGRFAPHPIHQPQDQRLMPLDP